MKNLVQMQQVHGNSVVRVNADDMGQTIPNCDALISNDPTVILGVRVADCLPISVTDKKGRGIGLIHAGWRGLDNKIIKKTIEKMSLEFQISNFEFQIKIGPHICAKHYEVKKDVASKFTGHLGGLSSKAGRTFLDLAKVAGLQLIALGVKRENITVDDRCTFEDKNLYSYRRDKTSKRNFVTLNI